MHQMFDMIFIKFYHQFQHVNQSKINLVLQLSFYYYILIKLILNKLETPLHTPPFFGHAIPLAKIAELLHAKLANSELKYVTFKFVKESIQKEFKTINIIGLYPDQTKETQQKINELPTSMLFQQIFTQFDDYLAQKKDFPDLIIADMFAVAPMKFAKKHGIPLIVNFPNSYGNIQNLFNFVSLNRSYNIEGFLINYSLPTTNEFSKPFDEVLDAIRYHGRTIFQSFIGLDQPNIMPANHTLVGLLPNRTGSELTPELYEWIESWKSQGRSKFLYISFGSMLNLSNKFIRRLASIFVKMGYPIIWSLRGANAEDIKDPLIFHRPWLPQQAILRLPQVRGYLTHCGWGSITEAIVTKTPLLCIPVFADQPDNARLVVKDTDNFRIPEEYEIDISEERINNGVTELMEDDTYYKSIERLNRMSSLHNSAENICRVVQEALEFGNAHLINPIYEKATLTTGTPLSKIIAKEYLPPNAQ